MGAALEFGSQVRVSDGETIDEGKTVDVGGMTGRVCDPDGYESHETGERMVGVERDADHGGGHRMVPERRVQRGRSGRVFGGLGRAYDRIFGKR
ncbi:MAG: hypothetical protein ACF8XB_09720 [Planctomycetota bacterium JB042]